MEEDRLLGLKFQGQSVWIDYLSRDIIESGHLEELIENDGLCGVTSNPTIFHDAMAVSRMYDSRLLALIEDGIQHERELFFRLTAQDVTDAAGLLLPVYQATDCVDGLVSIEAAPDLAYDTAETIREVRRVASGIGRKNVMVKVPGTRQGVAAFERLVTEGINVNVTLLFSVDRYMAVAEAYLSGLEARVDEGLPIDRISSVASFFISRIDTLVDHVLDAKAASAISGNSERFKSLRGQAGISSARIAYQKYRQIYSSERFLKLKEKGARPQRLLWASTSVKDPAYRDVMYAEELVGPDTVITMPEETLNAFRDHGVVKLTLEKDVDKARKVVEGLSSMGVDMLQVAQQLEKEGVRKFSESFFDALGRTAAKREMIIKKLAA